MKHPGTTGFRPALAHLDLGLGLARKGEIDAAIVQLRQYVEQENVAGAGELFRRVRSLLAGLEAKVAENRATALLVGIDHYPEGMGATTASRDIARWEACLKDALGYRTIRRLQNEAATQAALLTALQELAAIAWDHPCFLCLAGMGALLPGQGQGMLCSDGRLISFSSLESMFARARHLTVVIETGFGKGENRFFGTGSTNLRIRIGQATYYSGVQGTMETEVLPQYVESEEGGGSLTHMLTKALQEKSEIRSHVGLLQLLKAQAADQNQRESHHR